MAMRLSLSRRNRLIRHLTRAERTLADWAVSLDQAGPTEAVDPASAANIRAMMLLVSEARESVRRRLAELNVTLPAREQSELRKGLVRAARFYLRRRSLAGLCLRACRCCGRAVGLAYRVASAVADSATERVLYGSLRAFEKQLWVLDPRVA